MVSSVCGICGTANPAQAAFCFACGKPLQDTTQTIQTPGPTSTGALAAATLIQQRYRILTQVGKGGFGAVYKAADTKLGDRVVALKEMSQSGLSTQEATEATRNFKREAILLAGLTHPNLPRIYDHFLTRATGTSWWISSRTRRWPSDMPFSFAPLRIAAPALEQLILCMVGMDVSKRPASVADIQRDRHISVCSNTLKK